MFDYFMAYWIQNGRMVSSIDRKNVTIALSYGWYDEWRI